MSKEEINAALLKEAATWMMRLSDENSGKADWDAWQQWGEQSEQHRKLRRMTDSLGGKLQNIPAFAGRAALDAPRVAGRRAALKTLAVLFTVAPAGWLGSRLPWEEWNADYKTGTGAPRQIVLAEGTLLTLDTASAVDIVFDSKRRMVRLLSGRIFVATAADTATVARPFLVSTKQGSVRSIGTRFEVRQNAASSDVAVVHGSVEITPGQAGAQAMILQAGQRTNFSAASVDPPKAMSETEPLWLQGRIQVNNVRLAQLIEELDRYHPGSLRCDPAVADIRVSGRYRLDDTDLALQLLADTFPLKISRLTRYWITVGPR